MLQQLVVAMRSVNVQFSVPKNNTYYISLELTRSCSPKRF